jgi:hypothetical protein
MPRREMRSSATLLFASILAGFTVPAQASDALKRCRAIGESAARLACYDALPLEGAPAPTPVSPATAPASRVPATPALGVRATPVPAPAVSSPTPAPPAPSGQASLESSFGLEGRAPAAELPAIQSHIPGTFYGWGQGTQITLANGQVWQVVDDSGRRMQLQDAKVRVRRGLMGAFYLEFDAHNYSPRVRRIQ